MNILEEKLIKSIKSSIKNQFDIEIDDNLVTIDLPKDKIHGQFTSNICMRISKLLNKNPKDIANMIIDDIKNQIEEIEKIEIAGPGFINFFIKNNIFSNIINDIIKQNEKYGTNNSGNRKKILIEYVSANPTGSLHLGHARGAVWGDVCARLLKISGYDVLKEYYINDAGNQINNLSKSIDIRYRQLFGEKIELTDDCYHAEDIIEIAQIIKDKDGNKWLNIDEEEKNEYFKKFGMEYELAHIKEDLKNYRCEFDSWISEKFLYESGRVFEVIKRLEKLDLIYEKDGAIWFKSSQYGDDKDRVLKKADGSYTYFTPDISNHLYKIERGFDKLVDLWGADHFGYIDRMKNALFALGYDKNTLEVDIIQMVRLIENRVEVKMSKRSGHSYTVKELCEEVGVDTARYFFVDKALDVQMDFDLGLARLKTNENPVFYIQYAYVRLVSILKKVDNIEVLDKYENLNSDQEIEILRHLNIYIQTIEECAMNRTPNKFCNYIYKLAKLINSYYVTTSILNAENEIIKKERIAFIKSISIIMKNAFNIIGIEPIEKM